MAARRSSGSRGRTAAGADSDDEMEEKTRGGFGNKHIKAAELACFTKGINTYADNRFSAPLEASAKGSDQQVKLIKAVEAAWTEAFTAGLLGLDRYVRYFNNPPAVFDRLVSARDQAVDIVKSPGKAGKTLPTEEETKARVAYIAAMAKVKPVATGTTVTQKSVKRPTAGAVTRADEVMALAEPSGDTSAEGGEDAGDEDWNPGMDDGELPGDRLKPSTPKGTSMIPSSRHIRAAHSSTDGRATMDMFATLLGSPVSTPSPYPTPVGSKRARRPSSAGSSTRPSSASGMTAEEVMMTLDMFLSDIPGASIHKKVMEVWSLQMRAHLLGRGPVPDVNSVNARLTVVAPEIFESREGPCEAEDES